jgi:sRNA-binding protein
MQAQLVKALGLSSADDLPPIFQEQRAKPLEKNVVSRLIAQYEPNEGVRVQRLRSVIGRYTKSVAYCRAMERETHRYGLDDKPVGLVEEADRVDAIKTLDQHIAYRKRRKEQRDAAEWRASNQPKNNNKSIE